MNKERNPIILLPYDFTEVSDGAVKHACALAKMFGYSLRLLNILDPGTIKYMRANNMKISDIESKLEEMAEMIRKDKDIEVDYVLKKGSIKTMCKLAEAYLVSFMVLGIDEPRKNNSQILKVVSKSPVPVFVIQRNSEMMNYKNILFPLDDFFASRQKVGWAARLAKTTNAQISIFSVNPPGSEEGFKYQRIIEQVEEFFYQRNIPYSTTLSEGGMDTFTRETVQFGTEHHCDVYVIMHRPKKLFGAIHPIDYQLIFNESRTPVLCVNLQDIMVSGGFS